jgi:hypothetical protein
MRRDGLGHVSIHSPRQTSPAIPLNRPGRHGNDRPVLAGPLLAGATLASRSGGKASRRPEGRSGDATEFATILLEFDRFPNPLITPGPKNLGHPNCRNPGRFMISNCNSELRKSAASPHGTSSPPALPRSGQLRSRKGHTRVSQTRRFEKDFAAGLDGSTTSRIATPREKRTPRYCCPGRSPSP